MRQHLKCVETKDAFSEPHALQSCWDWQLAGLQADALRVALECGLFAHLDGFITADALAETLSLDAANTGYLLELLWAMEVLEREDSPLLRYRNRPMARQYLNAQSADYCGDALLFRHRVLRASGTGLGDFVRKGTSKHLPDTANLQRGWAQAAKVQIAQEQRAVTRSFSRPPAVCWIWAVGRGWSPLHWHKHNRHSPAWCLSTRTPPPSPANISPTPVYCSACKPSAAI